MNNDTYTTLQIEKITLEIAQIRNEIAMQPQYERQTEAELEAKMVSIREAAASTELTLKKIQQLNREFDEGEPERKARIKQLNAQTRRDTWLYPVFVLAALGTAFFAGMSFYQKYLAVTP